MVALQQDSPLRLSTGYQNPISIILCIIYICKLSLGRILTSPAPAPAPIENCKSKWFLILPAKTSQYNANELAFILAFIAWSERTTCNAILWKRILIIPTMEPANLPIEISIAQASRSNFPKHSGLKLWMPKFTMRMNRRCLLYSGINRTVVFPDKIRISLIWNFLLAPARGRGRSMNPPLNTTVVLTFEFMWVGGLESRIHTDWVL